MQGDAARGGGATGVAQRLVIPRPGAAGVAGPRTVGARSVRLAEWTETAKELHLCLSLWGVHKALQKKRNSPKDLINILATSDCLLSIRGVKTSFGVAASYLSLQMFL